jgi:hypothetical protein
MQMAMKKGPALPTSQSAAFSTLRKDRLTQLASNGSGEREGMLAHYGRAQTLASAA